MRYNFQLTLLFISASILHGVEITYPVAFQVVQRGEGNLANIKITGKATGNVEARVLNDGGLVMQGLDWKSLGAARAGLFSGEISKVPTGGPYIIEVRSAGQTAAVKNLLVGDLWVDRKSVV